MANNWQLTALLLFSVLFFFSKRLQGHDDRFVSCPCNSGEGKLLTPVMNGKPALSTVPP